MGFKDSLLAPILQQKRAEVEALSGRVSEEELKSQAKASGAPRGFAKRLRRSPEPAVIAEVKRASPSRGWIREDLDPVSCARQFGTNGAACLSVLTDEKFFSGHLEYIRNIRQACPQIPILRKDFFLSPLQVFETRTAGADAVLVIVAALSPEELDAVIAAAFEVDLDVLVEVHNESELDSALPALARRPAGTGSKSEFMLGINNRDLTTFKTDINVTNKLVEALSQKAAPEDLLIVTESGIFTAEDIVELHNFGAQAYLIGESLVASGDPGENLRELIETSRSLLDFKPSRAEKPRKR